MGDSLLSLNTCPDCDVVNDWIASNGKCKKCQGTGYKGFGDGVMFEIFSPPENQFCENCGGSGICPTCHGEGILKSGDFFGSQHSHPDREERTYSRSDEGDTVSSVTVEDNNTYSGGGGGWSSSFSTTPVGEDNSKLFMFIWYIVPGIILFLMLLKDGEGLDSFLVAVIWPIAFVISVPVTLTGSNSMTGMCIFGVITIIIAGIISIIIKRRR